MSRTMKLIIFVLIPAAVFLVGYYIYCSAATTSLHVEAEKSLDNIYMVRGSDSLRAEMVRERVAERMKFLGLEVRTADVDVQFEILNDENIHELPRHVRSGIDLTRKLPGEEPETHVLKLRFPLQIRKGLVKRKLVIERVFAFKGRVEGD